MGNDSRYVFLLIGKTGSGKSATGNSILGEKHFASSDKGISVTKEISVKTVTRNGYTVTAIDAPGVMDTSIKSDGAKTKSCTEMTSAMSQVPIDGKLAIVLVLKYGERFTEENRLTMYILKNIFGDKDLWKSCIIVMTHGDLFQINNEDDVTFESWLRDQEDELGELFKDCSYRCVLFNNRTKQPEKNEQQFLELVNLTEQLDQDYTMNKFFEAKKRQNRLMLEENMLKVLKDYDEKMKSFSISASHLSCKNRMYDALVVRINEFYEELNKLDSPQKIYYIEGEPLLFHEQRQNLSNFKQEIKTKVTLNKLERQVSELNDRPAPNQNPWRLDVKELQSPIDQLSFKISNNKALYEYRERLSLLYNKHNKLILLAKRYDIIDSYRRKIDKLSYELNALPIPSELAKFTPYFVEVDKLKSEVVQRNNEIGGLGVLFTKLDKLHKLIEFKLEDSSVTSGWNRTSLMMGVVSTRTVFIPGVGIPLSIGLNALPLIGKTVHRQYLKYKNDTSENN